MQVFFISAFLILYFNNLVTGSLVPSKYRLEQLQVLFRHGDRTPNKPEIFQNDPNDEVYQSYGYGQLTKIGNEREYKIGKLLRKRYNAFLGNYKNGEVYAYSSDYDRTKMSLQLVLAGLYPPSPPTSWSSSINWQPIPTHYDENSFLTAAFSCPLYKKLFQEITNAPEISGVFQKNRDFFRRLEKKTGITMTNLFSGFIVYSNLRAALSLGLPLPAWCSKEDFVMIQRLAAITFKSMSYTEQLRRILAGPTVEQFLKVLNDKETSTKIYLYGGHEFNVASIIDSHNITGAPDIQDYGSTIILERLRGSDDQIYVRMYLWTGVSEKLISLKIKNCGRTCLLSDYEKIVQTILPNDASRTCTSPSTLCRRQTKSAPKIDLDLQIFYLFTGTDLTSF